MPATFNVRPTLSSNSFACSYIIYFSLGMACTLWTKLWSSVELEKMARVCQRQEALTPGEGRSIDGPLQGEQEQNLELRWEAWWQGGSIDLGVVHWISDDWRIYIKCKISKHWLLPKHLHLKFFSDVFLMFVSFIQSTIFLCLVSLGMNDDPWSRLRPGLRLMCNSLAQPMHDNSKKTPSKYMIPKWYHILWYTLVRPYIKEYQSNSMRPWGISFVVCRCSLWVQDFCHSADGIGHAPIMVLGRGECSMAVLFECKIAPVPKYML